MSMRNIVFALRFMLIAPLLVGTGANAVEPDHIVISLPADEQEASQLTDKSPQGNEVQANPNLKLEKGFTKNAMTFGGNASVIIPDDGTLGDQLAKGQIYVGGYIFRESEDDGGMIAKREGTFVLGTVPADHSQIHFGVWDGEKGYVSLESPSGVLRSGAWQHVGVIASEAEMAIYVNGKKVASSAGVKIPQAAGPLSVGVGLDLKKEPTQAPFRGKIDEFIICNALPSPDVFAKISAAQTEDFRSTLVTATRPPLQKPAATITEELQPQISKTSPKSVRLENAYMVVDLDWSDGLKLSRFFNKYTNTDCLRNNRDSGLFYYSIKGSAFDSRDFKEVDARISQEGKFSVLQVDLRNTDQKINATMKIRMDGGPEMEWLLSFQNDGGEKISLRPGFPYLSNLQVGDNLAENYYFFPYASGWVGKRPFLAGLEYGTRCWLQALDVSNPTAGGGVYTWPKDKTGQLKSILVRKTREDGTIGTDYNIVRSKPINPFEGDIGVSLGVFWEPEEIASKSSFEMTPAAIGVHGGTAVDSLKRYGAWANATWYQHDPIPDLLKKDFQMIAVLHDAGNDGFQKGLISKENTLIASDQIQSGREDNHLQFAMWWHHPAWGTDPDNGWGDYDYNEKTGGKAALAEEIKKCQEKGSHVSLYLCSRALGPNTRIGKAHTEEWGFMDEPGQYSTDWGSLNFCTHIHDWQDYLGSVYTRLMKDLHPDGLYLDTSAEVLRCHNPKHKHAENLVDDQTRLLKTIRNAIKSVNPQAFFMVEYCGSDYWSQFVDAAWVQTWAHPHAKHFNDYDLCYFRFVFPQVKLFEWGMNADTYAVDSKRGFFNGIGLSRGDLKPEQTRELAIQTAVLRENTDAFSGLTPEALIPTEVENLYANKFPAENKVAYTLYNKNTELISGPLLIVAARENRHFVDVTNHAELTAKQLDGRFEIAGQLAPYQVACILDLPRLLTVHIDGANAVIAFSQPADGVATKAFVVRNNVSSELPLEKSGEGWTVRLPPDTSGAKLVVKALSNDILLDQIVTSL